MRAPGIGKFSALALLFAFPLEMLMPGALDADYALLLLVCLPALWRSRNRGKFAANAWIRAYAAAMCSPLLAEFLSQLATGQWDWQPYDRDWRFVVSVPIFLALRTMAPARLRIWRFGVLAGALGCGVAMVVSPVAYGYDGRLSGDFLNPIYYGDFAASLALLAAFSVDWGRRDAAWLRALSWLGFAVAAYASLRTGARGAWLALLLLPLLRQAAGRSRLTPARMGVGALLFVCAAALIYAVVPEVRLRMGELIGNLESMRHGYSDTSVGIRLQHWRVALLLFERHPLFGVGTREVPLLMPELARQGWLTPEAMRVARGELHSEILAHAAAQGIVGVAAVVAVYAVPAARFWTCLRGGEHEGGLAAAAMGLAFIGAFFVFGLTVETFDLDMIVSYYALTVVVLLAACDPLAASPCANVVPCAG
jgi:O-antigen ligase